MRSKTLSAEQTKGNLLLRKQASVEGFDAADFALGFTGAGSGDSANAGSRAGQYADPLAGTVVSGGAVISSENGRSLNRDAIRIEESSGAAGEGNTPALRIFKKRGKEIVLKKANIQRQEGVRRVQLAEGIAGVTVSPEDLKAEADAERVLGEKKKSVNRMTAAKERAMQIRKQGVDNAIIQKQFELQDKEEENCFLNLFDELNDFLG